MCHVQVLCDVWDNFGLNDSDGFDLVTDINDYYKAFRGRDLRFSLQCFWKFILVGRDAVSIGVTWLKIRGGGSEFTIGNRNFNLRRRNVRMRKQIVSNQSLICRCHLPLRLPQVFICPTSTQMPKTKLFLRRKNSEGHLPPLPSLTKVTPMAMSLGEYFLCF